MERMVSFPVPRGQALLGGQRSHQRAVPCTAKRGQHRPVLGNGSSGLPRADSSTHTPPPSTRCSRGHSQRSWSLGWPPGPLTCSGCSLGVRVLEAPGLHGSDEEVLSTQRLVVEGVTVPCAAPVQVPIDVESLAAPSPCRILRSAAAFLPRPSTVPHCLHTASLCHPHPASGPF